MHNFEFRLPNVLNMLSLHKNESSPFGLLLFLERCVPHAERDAHFVRDDGFAL